MHIYSICRMNIFFITNTPLQHSGMWVDQQLMFIHQTAGGAIQQRTEARQPPSAVCRYSSKFSPTFTPAQVMFNIAALIHSVGLVIVTFNSSYVFWGPRETNEDPRGTEKLEFHLSFGYF